MKTAIVTGASSGIGLAISKMLLDKNYLVYGIARNFSKTHLNHENFIKISCDLTDFNKTLDSIKSIKKNHGQIDLLVNNAGIGHFGLHEELNPKKIKEMCEVNLIAPIIITNLLLRSIKRSQGFIINIASVTAKNVSPMGCAYSATKAGLYHFGKGLFEETRKNGVKVVNICPDMTKTPFFNTLNFKEAEEENSYITPECVAASVAMVLDSREGTVVAEIELRPQINKIMKK